MSLSLPPHEAHIWLAPVRSLDEDPALRQTAMQLLLPEEQQAWQRFVQEHSRDEYLLTRVLCRRVLSKVAAVDPALWKFERNRYGRPEIVAPLEQVGLRFNLSNTRGWAACLVVQRFDCGVDVENIARAPDLEALSRAVLAPAERALFAQVPVEARAEHFFGLWTIKEAYIKARGLGLALGMENITVSLPPSAPPRVELPEEWGDPTEDWQLHTEAPTAGVRLGVALRRGQAADLKLVLHHGVP